MRLQKISWKAELEKFPVADDGDLCDNFALEVRAPAIEERH